MIDSDMLKAARFWLLRGKYILLRQWGNVLVEAHVRTTPRSATDDTLREIIQEQLRSAIRSNEFHCHSIQEQYIQLGKEILHAETTAHQDAANAGAASSEAEAADP